MGEDAKEDDRDGLTLRERSGVTYQAWRCTTVNATSIHHGLRVCQIGAKKRLISSRSRSEDPASCPSIRRGNQGVEAGAWVLERYPGNPLHPSHVHKERGKRKRVKCRCGNRGCLPGLVSTPGSMERLRSTGGASGGLKLPSADEQVESRNASLDGQDKPGLVFSLVPREGHGPFTLFQCATGGGCVRTPGWSAQGWRARTGMRGLAWQCRRARVAVMSRQ